MTILLAATAVAGLAAPQVPHLNVDGREVAVRQLPALQDCRADRILPDPSSRRVVVWGGERDLRAVIRPTWSGNFVVAELPSKDSPRHVLQDFASVGGPRAEPLRWNANGDRLLFRYSATSAGLFDPRTRLFERASDLDTRLTRTAMQVLSHGDTAFYAQTDFVEGVRRVYRDGAPFRSLASVGPRGTTFLVFRPGNGLRLIAYDGSRRWDTGIPLFFASAPLLIPGERRPTFLGDQAGSTSFLPYALPLIDRLSGRAVGRFGLERIEASDGRKIDLGARFDQLIAIRDAAANGDAIFALVELEREVRIVRLRDDRMSSWRLCEKKGLQLGKVRFPAVDALPEGLGVERILVRFGSGGSASADRAFGFLYRPRRHDDRLVVHFHGGPTATLAGEIVPREVHDFAGAGVSVLAVEQSGMLGGGLALSRRLPRLGHKALRQDIAAVTRWVRRSGYRRVYLIADSFGAASGVIAASAHGEAYEHIFLRAPYLAVRPPEQSTSRRQFGQAVTSPQSQREFEEAVYGGARGRVRFAWDMREWVARLRPSPKLSFYFGSLDPVSTPSELPVGFAGHPSVKVVNATHEMTSHDSEVEKDIFSKMGILRRVRRITDAP